MLIQYYLANGEEINYTCQGAISPTLSDINNIALLYAQKCPRSLPDTIFVSVRVYSEFISHLYGAPPIYDYSRGALVLTFSSSVGVLKIVPMPLA